MPQEKRHRIYPVIRQYARELRQPQTPAEQKLWQRLRRKQLNGYYFRRQHPIGQFIADFYCAAARLIIEVDGDTHAEQEAYDAARTAWLESRDYRVIRFTNRQVFREIEAVLTRILAVCEQQS